MAKKAATKSSRDAKAAKTKPIEPSSITITYDLFDLPTAQHKAGLAGLLLQTKTEFQMDRRCPANEGAY